MEAGGVGGKDGVEDRGKGKGRTRRDWEGGRRT